MRNPVCVEMLYNEPFLNNEYLFEDLAGVKIENVMSHDRAYLVREAEAGKLNDGGEKYTVKTHSEEIPTISGEITFETIIPFTIKQQSEAKVNTDLVDTHTKVISGVSHIE